MNRLRRVTIQRRRPGRRRRRAWRAAAAGGMAVAVSLAASPALATVIAQPAAVPSAGSTSPPTRTRTARSTGANWPATASSSSRSRPRKPPTTPTRTTCRTPGRRRARDWPCSRTRSPTRTGRAARPPPSFAVRAARYRRGHGALPLVVDLENDPYSTSDCYWFGQRRMIAWIAGFATRARALTGSWPILYTTVAWWRECTGSTGRFTPRPALAGRLQRRAARRPVRLVAVVVLAVQRERLPARDRLDRPRRLPVGQRAPVAPPGRGPEAQAPPQAPAQAPAQASKAQEAQARTQAPAKAEEAPQAHRKCASIYQLQFINYLRIRTRAVDKLRR